MKVSEAAEKVCPFMSTLDSKCKCITKECMFWEVTISGEKEIDRKIVPYDMSPYRIADWVRGLENEGYVNIGRQDGFRNHYAKYEEANEGYCKRLEL